MPSPAEGSPPAGGVRRADPDRSTVRPLSPLTWTVTAAVLTAVAVAYGRARWPGALPIGSDNDEYQLVGQALARWEPPLVAGVEGTKYPLGYPALLAVIERLGLPVAPTALVLNLVALAVATLLVARLAGGAYAGAPVGGAAAVGGVVAVGGADVAPVAGAVRALPANPGAALAAGGVVVASVSVWNDAFSVMPELLTLAVVAAMLAVVAGGIDARRLRWLTVLAVVAVSLKTLTVLVVLGGTTLLAAVVWWGARRGRPVSDVAVAWPWLALPGGAAVATVLAGMLGTRGLPEHTTGYVATFLLVDPFDASLGRLGPRGLVRRTIEDVPDTLADLGRAIALIDNGAGAAAVVAVVGLGLGVLGALRLRRGGALGIVAAGMVLAYAVGMSAWPYHSSRFGLPLVPVAALGAGWLVRVVSERRWSGGEAGAGTGAGSGAVGAASGAGGWWSVLAGGVVVAALVATSWSGVVARGESSSERLARQHAAMEVLEVWAAQYLDERSMVSFDYREVAHRLGREVAPLSYTSDVAVLDAQVGDAQLVVKVDIHHTRNRQLGLLLDADPERFVPVLEGDGVGVWEVRW